MTHDQTTPRLIRATFIFGLSGECVLQLREKGHTGLFWGCVHTSPRKRGNRHVQRSVSWVRRSWLSIGRHAVSIRRDGDVDRSVARETTLLAMRLGEGRLAGNRDA